MYFYISTFSMYHLVSDIHLMKQALHEPIKVKPTDLKDMGSPVCIPTSIAGKDACGSAGIQAYIQSGFFALPILCKKTTTEQKMSHACCSIPPPLWLSPKH